MKNFLKLISNQMLMIQATILWIFALINVNSMLFWIFVIPAILVNGLQTIVDELREIKNKIK
jgi:hypothetical protein